MGQPRRHSFRDYSKREVKDIPDFFIKHPAPFKGVDEGVKAQGLTFFEFLQKFKSNNYQEDLWLKFKDKEVICFGSEGRKLFLRIAEIVISFHKEKKFSGNLISRIRVIPDLNVTHESPPMNNENKKKFERGGQQKDIEHFRWMVAAVVRIAIPNDYKEKLSEQFCLFFSGIFLTKVGVEKYFVSQLYHPIFFNSSDRCSLVRMIRHLYKLNPEVFQSNFRLKDFESWWSKIEDRMENGQRVKDTLFDVLHHNDKFYYYHSNGCTLPLYIRNVHEHLKKGENDHKKIDLELDDLFPGISAVFIDSAIRNLHGYWSVFGSGTTLSDLQLTPPHGWCFPYYRFRN